MYSCGFLLNTLLVQLTVFDFVHSSTLSSLVKPNRSHIMDGELTSIKKVPYQVLLIEKSLKTNKNSVHCGGSILTPRLILTAAHCVAYWEKPLSYLKVAIGSGSLHELFRDPSKQYSVDTVIIFPDYHTNGMIALRDFAILSLVKPLNMNQPGYRAQPVSLADKSYAGKNAIASGFGQMPESPEFLRSVDMPIVTNDQCKKEFDKFKIKKYIIDHSMLCAGSIENNKDVSPGDSGGPLVVKENGRFVQVGVASWGRLATKDPDLPAFPVAYGVFGNISYVRGWIESIIKSSE